MKGLTEIPERYKTRSPGWHVRLRYCNGAPQISQVFKDSDYGSHEKAKSAAIAFIKLVELKTPGTKSLTRLEPTARSKSGVVGVHRARVWAGASKGRPKRKLNCYCWVASWYENDKLKNKSFGETKWGPTQPNVWLVRKGL